MRLTICLCLFFISSAFALEGDLLKVSSLYKQKNYHKALYLLQKLSSEFPNSPEVSYDKGLIYSGLGNKKKAQVAFENALKKNPTFYPAYESLVDNFLVNSEFKSARALLKSGREYLNKEHIRYLEKQVEDGEQRNKDNQINGAYSLLVKGRYRAALKVLQTLEKSFFNEYYKGISYFKLNENANALRHLKEASKFFPENSNLLFYLAETHKRLNNIELAIKNYKSLLNKNKKFNYLGYEIAQLYERRGRYLEAIHFTEVALQSRPYNFRYHAYLGYLFYREGRLQSSITEYQKAISYNKNDIESYHSLERIFLSLKDYKKAEQLINKGLLKYPDDAELLMSKAYFLSQRADYSQAIKIAKKIKNEKSRDFLKGLQANRSVKVNLFFSKDDYNTKVIADNFYDKNYITEVKKIAVQAPFANGHQVMLSFNSDTEKRFTASTEKLDYAILRKDAGLSYQYENSLTNFQFKLSKVDFSNEGQSATKELTSKQDKIEVFSFGKYSLNNLSILGSIYKTHYVLDGVGSISIGNVDQYLLSQRYQYNRQLTFFANQMVNNYDKIEDYREFRAGIDVWMFDTFLIESSLAQIKSAINDTNFRLLLYKEIHIGKKYKLGSTYTFSNDLKGHNLFHRILISNKFELSKLKISFDVFGQKNYASSNDEDLGFSININILPSVIF